MLTLINDYRASNGLTPVSLAPALSDSALGMAVDMAAKSYFSHFDSQGRSAFQRMIDAGYVGNVWRGENLAVGPADAETVLTLWIASPTHNEVILNPAYIAIGIGRAYGTEATGWYWAADFGG